MSAIRKQKITPCLWFNFNAEEAVAHYTSIFKGSKVTRTLHYGDENPELKGKVLLMEFELAGQQFQALNVGPQFPFTNAISLSVDCDDQAEVDRMWARLCEGGSEGNCSWLTDKFGLCWQIVPERIGEILKHPKAMAAMMTMVKFDIAALEAAAKE